MSWQPIETAPPDDNYVLVYGITAGEISGIDDEPRVAIAGKTFSGDYYAEGFHWIVQDGDAYAVWCKPTHWMPLPAAPESAGQ